jgi:hypothetical protein
MRSSTAEVVDTPTAIPVGTQCTTGQTCPESGIWTVVGAPRTASPIVKGKRFPPYRGKAAVWQLALHA